MTQPWHQDGYAVVSDPGRVGAQPFIHRFLATRWEAERELRTIQLLPRDIAQNPRIVRAVLSIEKEWPL